MFGWSKCNRKGFNVLFDYEDTDGRWNVGVDAELLTDVVGQGTTTLKNYNTGSVFAELRLNKLFNWEERKVWISGRYGMQDTKRSGEQAYEEVDLATRFQDLNLTATLFGDLELIAQYRIWQTKGDELVAERNNYSEVIDYSEFVKSAKEHEIGVVVAADLLSLSLLSPPGEWGADVVVGTSQRFGVPMGYGGPHAAYFATFEKYKRSIPGRIIGVSEDVDGNRALRMALQTREQHIKREKATSNICTAQVLLAVMAGMYAVYHGEEGLRGMSKKIHSLTATLAEGLTQLSYHQLNANYFDTLKIGIGNVSMENIKTYAEDAKINLNYIDDETLSISIDEKDDLENINDILEVFAKSCNHSDSADLIKEVLSGDYTEATARIPEALYRKSSFMQHEVFNKYHSETEMMRYMKSLENKDLSLTHSMIPLGSCTMKLNAASELFPLSWSEFGNLHPFAPSHQARGYHIMFHELEEMLCEITGFEAISLQPNSGAQGEYAGLMVIKAYHESRGDFNRTKMIIPSSAHGTNPASAIMAGMNVVVIKCDKHGNIDRSKAHNLAIQYYMCAQTVIRFATGETKTPSTYTLSCMLKAKGFDLYEGPAGAKLPAGFKKIFS